MQDRLITTPLLVGVDDGPRQTLEPLAAHWGIAFASSAHEAALKDTYWRSAIEEARAAILFCGTSDSSRGRKIEASARRAASKVKIPVVAIEDFPGNYGNVESAQTEVLVVESERVAELSREKLGRRCPAVLVISPPRYDVYRQRFQALRERINERWRASSGQAARVLWAGQPETSDSLATLRAVVPALQRHRAKLLFKAHPRDPGYSAGAYRPILAGMQSEDVTQLSVPDALALAPQLVLTQFSSVAIEAGFFGIPSLHVLLDHAGGARLMQKKGYPLPPYCLSGATACVTDEAEIAAEVTKMLNDPVARSHTLDCFDDYFHSKSPTLPQLVAALEKYFQGRGFSF